MRFGSRVDRVLAGWFVGVLCALLIALGALWVINRTVYDPAGQVRQYFQALREGNGERALGILGAEVPDSNAAMLNGDAAKNALTRLSDIEIKSSDISGDGKSATVIVSYTLNGTPKTTDFELEKVGSHWGVFDQWHIKKGTLPTVHLTSNSSDAATLNNEKVAVPQGDREFAVFYPGEFTATYESALYSSQAQVAEVTSAQGEPQELNIKLQPSDSAQHSITSQIKSGLDTCAAQNALYPEGCPFEYDFSGRVSGDVSWKITQYPEPKATVDAAGKWVLPSSEGKAEISFTELDLFTGETRQVHETVTFPYDAQLTVDQEKVTVSNNY